MLQWSTLIKKYLHFPISKQSNIINWAVYEYEETELSKQYSLIVLKFTPPLIELIELIKVIPWRIIACLISTRRNDFYIKYIIG